ncbi:MAG: alpha/beta fold hydrolase [Bacteriovoracales bacterium]|nr:alpha/beta fold hydrolase [Bacteriovoracales bacterium]
MSSSDTSFFTLPNKSNLHVKVVDGGHSAWLVATHGIAEHLGRHKYLIDLLKEDFNLLLYDLRGHGRSSGRRVYIDRFSHYYEDLEGIISILKERYKMERFALFGHSMGATITCGYIQNQTDPSLKPEKIYLSSPGVAVGGKMKIPTRHIPPAALKTLAAFPYSVELGGLIDLDKLSHDKKVAKDYRNDPLNSQKIHIKLILELILAMKTVFSRPLRAKINCYCAYGTQDEIIDPKAVRDYFHFREHKSVVKIFKGAYHEIHNETEEFASGYFQFLKDSLTGRLDQSDGKASPKRVI